jgi:hypothetical protein
MSNKHNTMLELCGVHIQWNTQHGGVSKLIEYIT